MKTLGLLLLLMTTINFPNLFAQEKCLKDAENALNVKHYKETIINADLCIQNFGAQALDIQRHLTWTPPTGNVSPEMGVRINKNGLLNDVATALFYKGEAALALYQQNKNRNSAFLQTAIDAYTLTLSYDKGRHWDPQGWFWSPAEGAQGKLTFIRTNYQQGGNHN